MTRQFVAEKWRQMTRKKIFGQDVMDTSLKRCLNTMDLTFLGIGMMLGAGIFVVTGAVMRDKAGPATFLAYAIAGVVAILNALCYAELACRFPKAGSGYIYSYVSTGELAAFVIGWSMILEYVLSAASVARGWSGTVDILAHHAISNYTLTFIGNYANVPILGMYPDLLSLAIVVVLSLVVLTGPKNSVFFNTSITIINLLVISFTIIAMLVKAHPSTFAEKSMGGFIPFSFLKVVSGATTCFYAFIGFDGLSICVEEAKTPKRSMPIALPVSVFVVSVLLVTMSLSLALFVPWYTVDTSSAFPAAFEARGMQWAAYIVGYGSLFGITASLFTTLFSMPRIVYAMANDGLIFRFLGLILEKTHVPWVSIIIFGSLTGLFAVFLDISSLADFLSIGTLITYSIVNATILILRYRSTPIFEKESSSQESSNFGTLLPPFASIPVLKDMAPSMAVNVAIAIFASSTLCALLILVVGTASHGYVWWVFLLVAIFSIIAVLCVLVMAFHQQNLAFDSYKLPFVPALPCICIVFNLFLIVNLSWMTWVRYFVWLAIGLVIYFFYGMKNSSLNADSGAGETSYLLKSEPKGDPKDPVDADTTLTPKS